MMMGCLTLGPVSQPSLGSTILFSDLKHCFLNFLVNSWHSNKPGWSHFTKSVNQRPLEGCFVCKPDCGSTKEAEIDVNDLGSNVTQWQIRDTVLSIDGPVEYLLTNLGTASKKIVITNE